jgi:hypothetical protein
MSQINLKPKVDISFNDKSYKLFDVYLDEHNFYLSDFILCTKVAREHFYLYAEPTLSSHLERKNSICTLYFSTHTYFTHIPIA